MDQRAVSTLVETTPAGAAAVILLSAAGRALEATLRILGIDPGVTGALALYQPHHKTQWIVIDLPASTPTLMWWVNRWCPTVCYIERTFRNERLVEHTGYLRGVIEACLVPVVRVSSVSWKAHFKLLKTDKRTSLAAARKIVGNIPELTLQKHHNRAEAILIAAYGAFQHGTLL